MTFVFDGRGKAQEKGKLLSRLIRERGLKPYLVSILVGNDTSSRLFLKLKKKFGEKIGCKVKILHFAETKDARFLIEKIKELNANPKVHGIMLQLPLPANFLAAQRDEILESIDLAKDVDGLRANSPFLPPVVKAVILALRDASFYLASIKDLTIAVVGGWGFEGRRISQALSEMGYKVERFGREDKENLKKILPKFDVVISVTGEEGLINGEMVKKGSVVIDVGSPKGDVRADEVYGKSSFLSKVPGGIGPLTIFFLFENLVQAALKRQKKES